MSAMAGDLASFDSELLAALNLANERSVPWMKAYLHWAQMHAAAQRQQAAELTRVRQRRTLPYVQDEHDQDPQGVVPSVEVHKHLQRQVGEAGHHVGSCTST